jgi:hypothetical protein
MGSGQVLPRGTLNRSDEIIECDRALGDALDGGQG